VESDSYLSRIDVIELAPFNEIVESAISPGLVCLTRKPAPFELYVRLNGNQFEDRALFWRWVD
jgi:hypothetical protein